MTADVSIALWLLIGALVISAMVNVSLIGSLARPWWLSIRDKTNGPKTAILRGTMRRRLWSVCLHAALLVQLGSTLALQQAPPLIVRVVVTLVIVLALIADAVGDMFDYRLLRGLLKEHDAR